jgi:hypothetical protein
VSLKDVSVQDVSVILDTLKFLTLVEPFRRNAISGKAINRMRSYEDIMDLDNASIRRDEAESFFDTFVQEWKSTGLIPQDLLRQSSVASSNVKVCGEICVVDSLFFFFLFFFLLLLLLFLLFH